MIRRILTKYTSLTHYQNLLVAQASVYIFGSAVRAIVNTRVSLSLEFFYCYAGTPLWIVTMFRAIFNSVVIAEITMMLLFTIYRLLHCFKPKQTWLFYFVVIPIAFLCVVSAGVMSVWRPEIYGFCMLAYLTAILLITSSCYFILRRHFRLNKYSILVRKMQNKLSKGVASVHVDDGLWRKTSNAAGFNFYPSQRSHHVNHRNLFLPGIRLLSASSSNGQYLAFLRRKRHRQMFEQSWLLIG
ncbi:hypothetical protein V3C99_003588 [Haemonchus contortus]